MIAIQINKDGKLSIVGIVQEREVEFSPAHLYMDCSLNCTVGDVFKFFREHLEFFEEMFENLEEFIEESERESSNPLDDIEYVSVDKHVVVCDNDIAVELDLTGWCDKEENSLTFVPIPDYIHVPFRLGNAYYFNMNTNESRELKTTFSLFDVLFALWYDISFYGVPPIRDETFRQLKEDVEEMQRRVDSEDLFQDVDWGLYGP